MQSWTQIYKLMIYSFNLKRKKTAWGFHFKSQIDFCVFTPKFGSRIKSGSLTYHFFILWNPETISVQGCFDSLFKDWCWECSFHGSGVPCLGRCFRFLRGLDQPHCRSERKQMKSGNDLWSCSSSFAAWSGIFSSLAITFAISSFLLVAECHRK